ncbi:kinase-like domain-containing protein [Gigaspora rosea]|uniref:Kinase-like domain-containing protein n=1 Tax=Gigaspora rosea TaxID=44941 RepID=A0A397VYV7_9GLOM|nr:kinase-like domain-containing protein [Gigaspora rosea]
MDFHSCEECGQKSSYVSAWCRDCNSRHFQEQFKDWTSRKNVIDKFIQETQLKALNKFQKLEILYSILEGLNDIHNAKLIHRDLHSRNIVLFDPENAYITDFGSCRPAIYDFSNENQVYRVVPYIAPEVLRGVGYTKSANIYSFGILVNEVATGLPPHNYPHDTMLALRIIDGLRPMIDTETTP